MREKKFSSDGEAMDDNLRILKIIENIFSQNRNSIRHTIFLAMNPL